MTNAPPLLQPTEKETACWVAFDQLDCKGLGGNKIRSLFDHFGGLVNAWQADRLALLHVPGMTHDIVNRLLQARASSEPEQLIEKCRAAGVRVLPYCHPDYPPLLKEIHNPPSVLYIKGALAPDDLRWNVGVVGTRKPTPYGQKMAKDFSRDLAAHGVTIISGMAYGIDSFAHRGAIDGGGKTFAVLGCGPDVCYPSSNRPLYKMLTEEGHGAVLSEYFPGTPPDTFRFPQRNRIVSGLCQAVLVVEAGKDSGSLITARLALDDNREVFAIPGRIDSPMSEGTNDYIVKSQARMLTNYEDLLQEMGWAFAASAKSNKAIVELYGKEKDVYELLSEEPIHFDLLVERSGLAAGELSATLTMLELGGTVTRHPGDSYSRNR